jgi:hypothetical protein
MRVKEIPLVDDYDYDANFRVFFLVLWFVIFFVYVAGVAFFGFFLVRNTYELVKRKDMMDVKML